MATRWLPGPVHVAPREEQGWEGGQAHGRARGTKGRQHEHEGAAEQAADKDKKHFQQLPGPLHKVPEEEQGRGDGRGQG